jgi:hypothetical protein
MYSRGKSHAGRCKRISNFEQGRLNFGEYPSLLRFDISCSIFDIQHLIWEIPPGSASAPGITVIVRLDRDFEFRNPDSCSADVCESEAPRANTKREEASGYLGQWS